MPEILHTLPIHGPRSKVYRALTEQEGLRGWWTRFATAEPTIGYINEFGFGGESHSLRLISIARALEG